VKFLKIAAASAQTHSLDKRTGHLVSVRHVLEHAGGKIAATGILAALGTLIGP